MSTCWAICPITLALDKHEVRWRKKIGDSSGVLSKMRKGTTSRGRNCGGMKKKKDSRRKLKGLTLQGEGQGKVWHGR